MTRPCTMSAGRRPRGGGPPGVRRAAARFAMAAACVPAVALAPVPRLAAQDASEATLILSPEPGERVNDDAVLVAVSFVDRAARVDPSTVTLEVDGRDVTAGARVGARLVTWRPSRPLEQGPHRAALSARTVDGAPLSRTRWVFTVTPPADADAAAEVAPARPGASAPPTLRGSLAVDATGRAASGPGIALRRDEDFVPRLWLNAGGSVRPGWRYSARLHMSGYEDDLRQPVNRYGLDLRSEHLNLAVGDVNPVFHDLILMGHRVRGVQARLRGGPVELTVVNGESRRGVEGMLDPLDPARILRQGTFERDLFAVRPAIGSGRTFRAGLTLMRVRDDVESIARIRTEPDPVYGGTQPASPAPQDNIVVGADLTARLLRGRVLLQYDNAISFFANDISGGPLTGAQLDSLMEQSGSDPLDVDPSRWARLFTLNASMIPLDPRALTNIAHQLRSTVRLGRNMLSLEWRSIGGSYHTLGHPALQRDRRGVRIHDSFTLLDDALAVSIGFERDRDNLDRVKSATTTSTGATADVAWHPSRDRLALRLSLRLGGRANDLPVDAVGALDERSRMVSLGATHPLLRRGGSRTDVNLNVSLIDREDPANPVGGSLNIYLLGGIRRTGPEPRSRMSLYYGLNRSELTGLDDGLTNYHRLVANARRPLTARWTGMLDASFTLARSSETAGDFGSDYGRTELTAGGEWEWTSASFVTVSAGLVSYADDRFPGRSTREVVTRVRVDRVF